jgi:hypothetical protein
MKEVLDLLKANGFINGNDLPDETPGHLYHFRNSGGRMIVPSHVARTGILEVLKKAEVAFTWKSGIITLY